jgi:hypothetical protein
MPDKISTFINKCTFKFAYLCTICTFKSAFAIIKTLANFLYMKYLNMKKALTAWQNLQPIVGEG